MVNCVLNIQIFCNNGYICRDVAIRLLLLNIFLIFSITAMNVIFPNAVNFVLKVNPSASIRLKNIPTELKSYFFLNTMIMLHWNCFSKLKRSKITFKQQFN